MALMRTAVLAASIVAALGLGPEAARADLTLDRQCTAAGLRLNEVQLLGTHNSYHIEPDPALARLMLRSSYVQDERWPASRLVPALSYTFPPLDVQLSYGVRHLELDVLYDPQGGRFAEPGGYRALAAAGETPVEPFYGTAELRAPGFKVLHQPDLDVRSNCLTLKSCLARVREWSARNPDHVPIIIQLETKESAKPALNNAYQPAEVLPFDSAAFRALDAEIRAVFPTEALLTPDDVRGTAATLRDGVAAQGWPLLSAVQGRVMFTLGDTPSTQIYLQTYPGARGGILFPSVAENDPHTVWLNRYNPKDKGIGAAVRAGGLVYTRADAHGEAARNNDPKDRERAFASGAQIISTDYPWPDMRLSPYRAVFPNGGYVRANPLLRPGKC